MLDERDIVALLIDRPDLGLDKGQTGTIVSVYGKHEAFEVEFVDDDGFTYGLATFRPHELLKLHFKAKAA